MWRVGGLGCDGRVVGFFCLFLLFFLLAAGPIPNLTTPFRAMLPPAGGGVARGGGGIYCLSS